MEALISARTAALESASAAIEVAVRAIECVVISENSAVRNVGVVVIGDVAVIPVRSPMVPAPAKAAEIADSKPEAKSNSWSGKIESWIRIPARPDTDGLAIRQPGIILRHVNNLRVCRFDHNGLPLIAHVFL